MSITNEREVYRQTTLGAIYNFGGKNIGFLLNFFFTLIIARYLGPADYGSYSFYRNFATLVALFSILGLDTTLNRFVPEFSKKNEKHILAYIQNRAFLVSMAGFCVMSATILLFFLIIPYMSGMGYRFSVTDLLLFLGLVGALTFTGILRGAVSGLFHQRLLNITESLSITAKLLFTVGFFLIGLRVEGVLLAVMIAYSFPAVVYYKDLQQNLQPNNHQGMKQSPQLETEWKRVKRYSRIMFLFALAYFILGNELDVVMLRFISGEREAGFYNIAYRFAFINAMVFIGAIDGVLVPAFASLGEEGDTGRTAQRKALKNALRFTIFFLVPSATAGILFSDEIVNVFFGTNYSSSAVILSILYLTLLLSMAISWPLRFIFLTVGKERTVLKIYVVWGMINLVGNVMLISNYGGKGVALSTGFSAWGIAVHFIYTARKAHILEFPARLLFVSVLSSILVFFIFHLYLPSPAGFLMLALEYLCFTLAYAVLVLAMKGFSLAQLKDVHNMLRGKGGNGVNGEH